MIVTIQTIISIRDINNARTKHILEEMAKWKQKHKKYLFKKEEFLKYTKLFLLLLFNRYLKLQGPVFNIFTEQLNLLISTGFNYRFILNHEIKGIQR